MCFYIFPDAPNLFYQQGNKTSCNLSSVIKVWARTQHAPSFGVIRTAVRLHFGNQTMYHPTVYFRVLLSYVLWAYFINYEFTKEIFAYAWWYILAHTHHLYNAMLTKSRIEYMNSDWLVDIIRWVKQEQCISALFSFLISCSVPSLRYINQDQLMYSYVSIHILTL